MLHYLIHAFVFSNMITVFDLWECYKQACTYTTTYRLQPWSHLSKKLNEKILDGGAANNTKKKKTKTPKNCMLHNSVKIQFEISKLTKNKKI